MAELLCSLLQIYLLILFVRVVLSWFPIGPDGAGATFAGFLYVLTDPVLRPLRRILPPLRVGHVGLDLSPIVAVFAIMFVRGLVCAS